MGISDIWNKLSNIRTVPKAYAIGVVLVLAVVAGLSYGYEGEHLFSIEENIEHIGGNLNDKNISKQLTDRYKESGYPLSENVSISVLENGEVWEINDENKGDSYEVRKENGKLNIYEGESLYPKRLDNDSSLYPYDRGGEPLKENGLVESEYPGHEDSLGWITSYLTPFTTWLSSETHHLGTTIVSHPGGIIDEILYYTRGLDTVFEASILMMAFLLASYLMKRERRREDGG